MEHVIQMWQYNYYTELGMLLILFCTLIVSIIKYKSAPQLRLFPYYFISFLLLLLTAYIYKIFFIGLRENLFERIDRLFNISVTMLEFFVFSEFIYRQIQSKIFLNLIILLGSIIFIAFILVSIQGLIIINLHNYSAVNNFYLMESVILIIVCSFYFIELFKTPPLEKITNSAAFWLCTGLMFYLICTLPLTAITDYFLKTDLTLYRKFFSIFYIFYSLLFITIVIAYFQNDPKKKETV